MLLLCCGSQSSCMREVLDQMVMEIWLCRACDPEEARATFKMLKSSHIADALAHLYVEWARLESAAGWYPCMARLRLPMRAHKGEVCRPLSCSHLTGPHAVHQACTCSVVH